MKCLNTPSCGLTWHVSCSDKVPTPEIPQVTYTPVPVQIKDKECTYETCPDLIKGHGIGCPFYRESV